MVELKPPRTLQGLSLIDVMVVFGGYYSAYIGNSIYFSNNNINILCILCIMQYLLFFVVVFFTLQHVWHNTIDIIHNTYI